jgi:hypothetical protein
MGGMKRYFTKETANGLLLNIIQTMTFQSDMTRNGQNFYTNYLEKLQEIDSPIKNYLFSNSKT